jgi:hypothetical protein
MLSQLRNFQGGILRTKNVLLSTRKSNFAIATVTRRFCDIAPSTTEETKPPQEVTFYEVSNSRIIRAMLAGTGINALVIVNYF